MALPVGPGGGPMNAPDTKVCRKCGEEKPADDFLPRRGACSVCRKAYLDAYRSDPDTAARLSEQKREWRERNRPELIARSRANYAARRDEILSEHRDYYARNAEAIREKQRRRNRERPAVVRACNEFRRDRERLHGAVEEGKRRFADAPAGFLIAAYPRAGRPLLAGPVDCFYAPVPRGVPLRNAGRAVFFVVPAPWLSGGWDLLDYPGADPQTREVLRRFRGWWRRRGLLTETNKEPRSCP